LLVYRVPHQNLKLSEQELLADNCHVFEKLALSQVVVSFNQLVGEGLHELRLQDTDPSLIVFDFLLLVEFQIPGHLFRLFFPFVSAVPPSALE